MTRRRNPVQGIQAVGHYYDLWISNVMVRPNALGFIADFESGQLPRWSGRNCKWVDGAAAKHEKQLFRLSVNKDPSKRAIDVSLGRKPVGQ